MNLCKLIKEQTKKEALFCLMPYNTLEGYTQVCTAITYRNIEINLLFFAEKYNIKCYVGFDKVKFVWNDNETQYFKCLTCREMGLILFKANKEAFLIFLYSLFINMRRRITAYADASASAAYAGYASAAAAADAAYASASTAAAYTAYASAAAAYASASASTAAVYAAYDAAAADAAADAEVRKEARKAFRRLIELRKALLKEGDEEHE